jgi:hypothetical protein
MPAGTATTHVNGAQQSFIGTNGQGAAVSKSKGVYKTAFLGFPFEALASLDDRQETPSTFLNWCKGSHVFLPLLVR